MPGLDMLRASIERALPDPPLSRLTGLRLSEAGLGMASAAMPASLWWQSGAGVFLAGTSAFVADLPLGCAVLSGAPAGVAVTSSELSVNFLRPATIRSQSIIARARLIHSTRSLGLAEATIEDGRGRLLGHATSRCVLFPGNLAHLSSRRHRQSSSLPDPYLREVEGDVRGQEFWDSTPGIEVMRQTGAGLFRPPVFLLMGIRGVEASEGEMALAMPISDWLCNAFGVVYGGAIALLADAAMSLAAGSTVPAATAFSPLDMKVHFLRPVLPADGELIARARVLHRGRTIAVVTCEVIGPEDRLVAQASGSVLILPGRPWLRPVHVADEITQDTDRVLATVLFIDIVDSTRVASEMGDRRWKELLAEYRVAVREQLQLFRGTEIDVAGDGFLVSFDGAARAIRCAVAARDAVRRIGLEVRSGVHTGECELSGGKLVGLTVHIGSRLAAQAAPGEIIVSNTVRELASDSGITFADRGVHALKGITGEWRLYQIQA